MNIFHVFDKKFIFFGIKHYNLGLLMSIFEKIIYKLLSFFREEKIESELYSKKTLELSAKTGISQSGILESARLAVPPGNPVYNYAVGFTAGVMYEYKKKDIPKD